MLLYYITDRTQFSGTESQRLERLLKKISEAAMAGIDYIQLREKDLSARALEAVAKDAAQLINESRSSTRLLINSRTDIALAAKAHGVHLPSNDISPVEVRRIWLEAQAPARPIVAVSCHNESQVIAAERTGDSVAAGVHARPAADFVVFGTVFEKRGAPEIAGIDQLRKVCRHRIPVLALGGVTTENAHLCIGAGAGGVAGIRLFQENQIATVVAKLRGLK
ncbi:MAG TPA: thiamine phosphate synthase [Terriglobales bacterium]|nr:thiamine phosphate synthase [Terriglobales bacterium]